MYTWEDQNGQSLTLRPEMTASVVRAYVQKQIWKIEPISKFYYIGPLFRRERPQKGRLRQCHQFSIEAIGPQNPEQDAEVISIAYNIYKMFGVEVNLDHLGFNAGEVVYMTEEVVKDLEKAIKTDYHEYFAQDGFFWGQQFQEQSAKEYKKQDEEFLEFCKWALKNKQVVEYECSW